MENANKARIKRAFFKAARQMASTAAAALTTEAAFEDTDWKKTAVTVLLSGVSSLLMDFSQGEENDVTGN